MKLTTETSKLKEALQRLGFAVNSKSVLPVLANILVTVSKDEILLTTTDLMVTINYKIECETNGEGQFLMPFLHIKNIVAMETGNVTIEWNAKNGAKATFDNDIFSLGNHGEVTDFPKITKAPGKDMFELDNEFVMALRLASLSVSKDDMRPIMMNVCMELNKDSVTLSATDAHSLFTTTITAATPVEEETELLIPAVVAKIIDGFENIKVGFNKNHIAFESGPVVVTSKRAEGKFPNWRDVLPAHNGNMKIELHALKDAVNKAYIMSDATYNGIDLYISPKQLEVKSEEPDSGMSCSLTISTESTCEIPRIRLNGRLLKRMIEQLEPNIKDNSAITLSVQGERKAVTAQLADKNNLTVLLMPVNFS